MITIKRSDIKMITGPDDCGDISYLGEYSNTYKEGAIDRQELGDCRHGQYRYFIPGMTGEESGNPDSPMQDYKLAEEYNDGNRWFIFIKASVNLKIPMGNGHIFHKIESPGLYGIDCEEGEKDMQEYFSEEIYNLELILKELGVVIEE